MSGLVEVNATALGTMVRELKKADKSLAQEFRRSVKDIGKPVTKKVRDAVKAGDAFPTGRASLPRGAGNRPGSFRAALAAATSTKPNYGVREAALAHVSVEVNATAFARRLNSQRGTNVSADSTLLRGTTGEGRSRHPVFRTGKWVVVEPWDDWLAKSVAAHADSFRSECGRVLNDWAGRLAANVSKGGHEG